MKNIPLLITLFLLSLPLVTPAQEIEVDPDDQRIVIKGFIGDDPSFSGDVRVTLNAVPEGAAPPKLSVLTSPLKRADGEQINRQQVQVSGEITLTAGLPTTIPIKITGMKTHGEYKGKIELLLAGQPRAQAKTVELVVIASVRPTLTLLNDRVKTNLVNCKAPCWLGNFFLAASTQSRYELRFEKPVGAAVVIPDRTFDIKGEKSGVQLNSGHLKFGPLTAEPSGSEVDKRFITIPVDLVYSDLPADHYVGTISLSVDNQTPAVKVPVDVSLRVAPLWPLLLLIGGILLGSLSKYMKEKGGPAADALVAFNRIEIRYGEANQKDQEILRPALETAHRLIKENQPAAAVALTKLVESRLTTLMKLRDTEERLAGKENETVGKVLSKIRQARELVGQEKDAEVKKVVDEVETLTVALNAGGEAQLPDPKLYLAMADAKTAAEAASFTASLPPVTPPQTRTRGRRFLAWLTGITDDVRTEASLWLLRPLLWLVLILSLTALGMKSLYIDNPTFGSGWFDYVSLIFWGLSSDVASRTLGNLKPGGGANT